MPSEARVLVGYHRDSRLIFAGKLGPAFRRTSGGTCWRALRSSARVSKPPFANVPREYLKRAVWVRPRLVVEGEFMTWTADNFPCQAAFKGCRRTPAREVRLVSSLPRSCGKAYA
jgi:bifunctional non-homologous end joining protein LigD